VTEFGTPLLENNVLRGSKVPRSIRRSMLSTEVHLKPRVDTRARVAAGLARGTKPEPVPDKPSLKRTA